MNVTHVVGARPNFMKAAPVLRALSKHGTVPQRLVHTGQHYDATMSDRFFEQLELPRPDANLGVGSGSHAVQTAEIMTRLETELIDHRPSALVVYGDVNSTMAAAIVGAKLHIPIAHVEAGLRSFDRTMPEEINRIVTDRLASLFFTTSADADENLVREGIDHARIHRVGNVMIDSLVKSLPAANADAILAGVGLAPGDRFILVTLHRPSSVDDPELLNALVSTLGVIARECPVVFPVHLRTRARLKTGPGSISRLHLLDPVGYFEFLALERAATLVITDSGGVQEETTFLGVPCLTVRDNTERPVTITHGTNTLVGRDPATLLAAAKRSLNAPPPERRVPELWDGHAAERIAAVLTHYAETGP